MKTLIIAALTVITACSTNTTVRSLVPQAEEKPDVVQVMVVGSFHFSGSTSDLVNIKSDNVLSPMRQTELQDLAEGLSQFKPTVIVTERVTAAPDYRDPVFADFDEEMLADVPNERVQIAYRLARMTGVDRVYGLDEQPESDEPDYFPFDALRVHAEQSGQADALQAILQQLEEMAETEMEQLWSLTLSRALYEVNTGPLSAPDFYYALLSLDDGEQQPAAELNAYWFMRNAKIFSKLEDVTQPGDRVVMVYGAGHKYWLEHLISNSPGFEVVVPGPYLLASD